MTAEQVIARTVTRDHLDGPGAEARRILAALNAAGYQVVPAAAVGLPETSRMFTPDPDALDAACKRACAPVLATRPMGRGEDTRPMGRG